MTNKDKTKLIAELNDKFRQSFIGGRVMLTQGVDNLDTKDKAELLQRVRQFTAFTRGNDPHDEHDFGKIEFDGQAFFWKIDYYDKSLSAGSEDPSNPQITTRVLTIMRSDEY